MLGFTVFLDGVFVPADDKKLEFHALGSLSNAELADRMQAVRIGVLGYLDREGVNCASRLTRRQDRRRQMR